MALLLIIQPFFIRIGTMEQTRMNDGANPEKQGSSPKEQGFGVPSPKCAEKQPTKRQKKVLMKTKNQNIKKGILSALVIGLTLLLAGCYKPHTQREVEEFVANTVPEKASLIRVEEQDSHSGKVYCYVYKSDTRDLEFRAFSSRGEGAIGGYQLYEYYDVGRTTYYKDKMRPFLAACENSEMYNRPDATRVSLKMYMEDEEDAKAIAKVLAKCNTIVAEQWNYQPGADLTDHDVVGIFFSIYQSPEFEEIKGAYYLNGKDDEDAVYQELLRL